MQYDPYYNDIVKQLQELKGAQSGDPFEECVCDLLRHVYPTLTPIKGGSDHGQDGFAGSIDNACPIVLISTVGDQVLRNIRKNLTSYNRNFGNTCRIVIATPRQIRASTRKKIVELIEGFGHQYLNIHDKYWIANLLYRDSSWTKRLLGLSGAPRTLSVVPRSTRTLLDTTLVGRERVTAKLLTTNGDFLLYGQPGCGKTRILWEVTKSTRAYFVVGDNEADLAREIRDKKPSILLVDDTQHDKKLLSRIVSLRESIHEDFRIIAATWPSYRGDAASVLNISADKEIPIELLTRDQILQVIESAGIYGPNDLLREINNQSRGKPGLAVTICHFIKLRGTVEFGKGRSLTEYIRNTYGELWGNDITQILSCFAIGGDCGFTIDAVSEYLQVSKPKIQNASRDLSTGGVLEETNERQLSVYPYSLRYALVRDTFFSGATSFDHSYFYNNSTNKYHFTLTVIAAKLFGGKIDDEYLQDLLTQHPSDSSFNAYAQLGPNELRWVYENSPDQILKLGTMPIDVDPRLVVGKLLEYSPDKGINLHSQPGHPLRQISDWCQSGMPNRNAIERRNVVLSAVLENTTALEQISSMRAIQCAMSPKYRSVESDAGSGLSLTISTGHIHKKDMDSLFAWWPKILEFVVQLPFDRIQPLWELLEDWSYPGRHGMGQSTDENFARASKRYAKKMVTDVIDKYRDHEGVRQKLKRLSKTANLRISIRTPKDFDCLFPVENIVRDFRAHEKMIEKSISNIVSVFLKNTVNRSVARLIEIRTFALDVAIGYPDYFDYFLRALANEVQYPSRFVTAFENRNASPSLMYPFALRVQLMRNKKVRDIVIGWSRIENTRTIALQTLLNSEHPINDSTFLKVIEEIDGRNSNVLLFHDKPLPDSWIGLLLRHKSEDVKTACAMYLHRKELINKYPAHLPLWREAIINSEADDFYISEILKENSELAKDWFIHKYQNEEYFFLQGTASEAAIQVLSHDQRIEVIKSLNAVRWQHGVVEKLVGNDIDIFRVLLDSKLPSSIKLSPLADHVSFDSNWRSKAVLAMDCGYTAIDVSRASYGTMHSYSGSRSDHFLKIETLYRSLLQDTDLRVREIGRLGVSWCQNEIRDAEAEEEREAVYGVRRRQII